MVLGVTKAGIIRVKAQAWTPALFPSITGWWEARDLSATSDGASVTSLPGKVASRNFVQHTTLAVPTKQTRSGHHCLQFLAASSQLLTCAQTLSTMCGSTGLRAVVIELNGNPTLSDPIYWQDNFVMVDTGSYFGFHAATISSVPGVFAGCYDGVGANELAKSKNRFIPVPVSERHVLMMWRTSGSVLQCSLDGVAQTDVTSVGAPQNLTFNQFLAYVDSGGLTRQGNFWLYAGITSTANGTAGDRTNLANYLKALAGIS
jgi:hypothetical protein